MTADDRAQLAAELWDLRTLRGPHLTEDRFPSLRQILGIPTGEPCDVETAVKRFTAVLDDASRLDPQNKLIVRKTLIEPATPPAGEPFVYEAAATEIAARVGESLGFGKSKFRKRSDPPPGQVNLFGALDLFAQELLDDQDRSESTSDTQPPDATDDSSAGSPPAAIDEAVPQEGEASEDDVRPVHDSDTSPDHVPEKLRRKRWLWLAAAVTVTLALVAATARLATGDATTAPTSTTIDSGVVPTVTTDPTTTTTEPELPCENIIGYAPGSLDLPTGLPESFAAVANLAGIECGAGPIQSVDTDFGQLFYQEVRDQDSKTAAVTLTTEDGVQFLDARRWKRVLAGSPFLPTGDSLISLGPLRRLVKSPETTILEFESSHAFFDNGAGPMWFAHQIVMDTWHAEGGLDTSGRAMSNPHNTDVPDGFAVRQEFSRGFFATADLQSTTFFPLQEEFEIADWESLYSHIITTTGDSWLVVGERELLWIPTRGSYFECGGHANRARRGLPGASLALATVVGQVSDGCPELEALP